MPGISVGISFKASRYDEIHKKFMRLGRPGAVTLTNDMHHCIVNLRSNEGVLEYPNCFNLNHHKQNDIVVLATEWDNNTRVCSCDGTKLPRYSELGIYPRYAASNLCLVSACYNRDHLGWPIACTEDETEIEILEFKTILHWPAGFVELKRKRLFAGRRRHLPNDLLRFESFATEAILGNHADYERIMRNRGNSQ